MDKHNDLDRYDIVDLGDAGVQTRGGSPIGNEDGGGVDQFRLGFSGLDQNA